MLLSNTLTSIIAVVSGVLTSTGAPMLHLAGVSGTNGILLFWPTNFPNYFVEYNPSLSPTGWAASAVNPVIVGTNFVVTNTLSSPEQYFRLSQ